jgi:hypothetical protein
MGAFSVGIAAFDDPRLIFSTSTPRYASAVYTMECEGSVGDQYAAHVDPLAGR